MSFLQVEQSACIVCKHASFALSKDVSGVDEITGTPHGFREVCSHNQ